MDDDLKAYLDGMMAQITGKLEAADSRLEATEARLMARLNNSEERILNRLASLEFDFQNTKGFMLNDLATAGRRWLDMDTRVTKLEDDGRKEP